MKCMHFETYELAKKEYGNMKVIQAPIPKPKTDKEVLIKVMASSINSLDRLQANAKFYSFYKTLPGVTQIGGVDFSGYIVHPETLEPMEEHPKLVMGTASGGAFAQYVSVLKDHVMIAPDNLSEV